METFPLKADAVEVDELCVSRKHNLWLWTAVSRYSGQLLAFVVGDRSENSLVQLWARVPERWRRRLVYTDGYAVYAAFFSPWQHRPCEKGDGGTNTAEGVNNALRHRCGALVRRTSARCRDKNLLQMRVAVTARTHNRQAVSRHRKATQLKR